MTIVRFPGHRLERCGPDCEGCFICNGGLVMCEVCGGARGMTCSGDSMPTHCPGAYMHPVLADSVADGTADYVDGEWHFKQQEKQDEQSG